MKTIKEWKTLVTKIPELAAKEFYNSLESIPQKTRRAVFSHIVPLEIIEKAFKLSASSNSSLPLAGVPFLLKDLFDYPGLPTTASSTFLEEMRGVAEKESALSKSFRQLGGVFVGKTHLNEFAYGLSGENPHFGNCPHPRLRGKLSGGSSSGSAWAVAKGIVPIAFGTDTGGSIRVPAAWCGLYGIRLSPNEWIRKGCFPLARTFDTAGWFCGSASEMSETLQQMLRIPDLKRPRGLNGLDLVDESLWKKCGLASPAKSILEKIGAHKDAHASSAYTRATQQVAKNYSVLQSTEALAVHEPWLDERQAEYDPGVWQRIARARNWSNGDIESGFACEKAINDFFDRAWQNYDYVALPATNTPAISVQEHSDAYRSELLELTAPGSLARCPILTIPVQKQSSNQSVGIQILYKNDKSNLPLKVLSALEK
ncbi:amidase [Puniceicoccaceae bacterium K14]|nr:amidase [Puniceicoccaceae bacterium K14]